MRACYRILGDLAEAEDAAQEAFVIAFRSLPTWRGDGPFGAWLSRIAVRVALRQAARRRRVSWRNPLSASAGDIDAEGEASSRSPCVESAWSFDPARLSERAEDAAAIRSAVARLDEPYREVVALRFFAEMPLGEIAAQSGRPIGTVKAQLHRGLRRLRLSFSPGGER